MTKDVKQTEQSQPPQITHVIFDMDGVLLDTENVYTVLMNDIFKDYGKIFTWDEKVQVMGMDSKTAVPKILDLMGLADLLTPDEYMARFKERQEAFFNGITLLQGVERTVAHLKACNIPICVATSSNSAIFAVKTQNFAEFFSQFDHIIKGDNVEIKQGKPAPDIFELASSKFNVQPLSPANCLVFEDSPNGVTAATAAKMNCIMIPDSKLNKAYINAKHVLASMADFIPEAYGLPPYPVAI